MFTEDKPLSRRGSNWAIGGLVLSSFTALIVTIWILADFAREQEIVEAITRHLPAGDLPEANELAGELRFQSRLSVLLILNIVVSCLAISLLVRAYIGSQKSLLNAKVLATDILASIAQGIITTDSNASILSINPFGLKLLDCHESGIGIALKNLPEEHALLNEICQLALTEKKTVRERDYVATYEGHPRNLVAGCSLLRDHKQQQIGTVITIRDVTRRTLMEQRLLRMERYMGLGSLAAGLQHEIKNPLSALSLHVQLLSEALQEHDQSLEIQDILNVLGSETQRITSVLEKFRDFTSVTELDRTEFNIKEIISKLVRLIKPQAQQQDICIETEMPKTTSVCLYIDSVRIEQVLLNLAINAMAAMPKGGALAFRLRESINSVELDVADTGSGIPLDLYEKIFEPYFTTRGDGTGMGLAVSAKIIRQHNGSIDFDTSPEGTTFTITLPRNG